MIRLLGHRWTRIGVSVGALAGLLAFTPLSLLLAALGQVQPTVLLTALALFVGGHVVAAMKWRILLGDAAGLSVRTTLQAHFAGVIANLWLPGVVGGDIVRAGAVLRGSDRKATIALASLVDRLIDSASLMLLMVGGLCVVGARAQGTWQIVASVAATGLVGAAALAGAYAYLRTRRGHPRVDTILEAVHVFARRPGLILVVAAISAGVQAVFVLVNAQLGVATGMSAPLAAWFFAWPLAKLVALVPISAAGFGVREAALVALMQPFGDPVSAVMAAGLLWQGIFVAGGLTGWLVLRILPGEPAATARTAPRPASPEERLPSEGV